jgi:hypothetical protein
MSRTRPTTAPPRLTPPPHRPPVWLDLSDDLKDQLLRVLNRMLIDRLTDGEPAKEGIDHEPS